MNNTVNIIKKENYTLIDFNIEPNQHKLFEDYINNVEAFKEKFREQYWNNGTMVYRFINLTKGEINLLKIIQTHLINEAL